MERGEETALAPEGGLFRRLLGLTLIRIVLVTVLLVSSAVLLLRTRPDRLGTVEQVLYGVILATYAASLVYLLILRGSARLHRRVAWAQVLGDVLIATCLVYLTGGLNSIVVFMFPLTVVSAAVLLYRRGAIVAAVASSAALAGVVFGLVSGALPPLSPDAGPSSVPPARLAFFVLSNVSAIFLTAALASYLAEQLRSTRERLSLRELDFKSLQQLNDSIVRSISSGIAAADAHGRVTFLNSAAERLLERRAAEVRGQPVVKLFPCLEGRLAKELASERVEAEQRTPSGQTRWLRISVTPLRASSGRREGVLLAFEDLTELKAMEEAVKRSERMAAVGAMAAGLAHELRNPLASMSGSVQLLAESRAFSEEEQTLARIVLRETDRLNGLVTDFLHFARPPEPQVVRFRLEETVQSTATLFRNDPTRSRVRLETEASGDLELDGDASQLGQVLWNLLANAADAIEGEGTVKVSARAKGESVELAVADTGVGIAAADLPRIFEPFYTTKDKGTGLGLALAHAIVSAHGGDIRVSSQPGKGTTFTVELPRSGPPGRRAEGA